MAQTEIVTRQALEERVRPVLFINKVDRLITELQLSEEQIQKKLDQIIDKFNDLIELYAESPSRHNGKSTRQAAMWLLVQPCMVGVSLWAWLKQKGIKFSDIIKASLTVSRQN